MYIAVTSGLSVWLLEECKKIDFVWEKTWYSVAMLRSTVFTCSCVSQRRLGINWHFSA